MYSTVDKVWWVRKQAAGYSLRDVCDLFHKENPHLPKPHPSTVMRCQARFSATGSVVPQRQGRRPRAAPDSELVILAGVAANPRSSCRALGAQARVSHATVLRTLKRHKHIYKMGKCQELQLGNHERRVQFATAALEMSHANPQFLRSILFTGESSFTLHHSNKQNFQMSQTNSHSVHTGGTQYAQRVNVWAGIIDQHIIGPIRIQGSLTGPKYLDLLQNDISERLADLQVDRPIWYLQDGCPAHNYQPAISFLRDSFPGQVIGTDEPLAWPPHSPDLNVADFFLWSHIAKTVYANAPFLDEDSLFTAIEDCCASVSHAQLAHVQQEFYDRLGYCVAAGGNMFEHLL